MCPKNNLSRTLPAKFKLFNKDSLSTAVAQFVVGLRAQLCNLCLHWNLIPFWRRRLGQSPVYGVSQQVICVLKSKAKHLPAPELVAMPWATSLGSLEGRTKTQRHRSCPSAGGNCATSWPHQQDGEGCFNRNFLMNCHLLLCEVRSLYITYNNQSCYSRAIHTRSDFGHRHRCSGGPNTTHEASVHEVRAWPWPLCWHVNTKYFGDTKTNSNKGSGS